MGGINAMTQYQEFFGYKETGASTGIGMCTHFTPVFLLSFDCWS